MKTANEIVSEIRTALGHIEHPHIMIDAYARRSYGMDMAVMSVSPLLKKSRYSYAVNFMGCERMAMSMFPIGGDICSFEIYDVTHPCDNGAETVAARCIFSSMLVYVPEGSMQLVKDNVMRYTGADMDAIYGFSFEAKNVYEAVLKISKTFDFFVSLCIESNECTDYSSFMKDFDSFGFKNYPLMGLLVVPMATYYEEFISECFSESKDAPPECDCDPHRTYD